MTSLCAARLRDGSSCQSVPTAGDLCAHHAGVAEELGREVVLDGVHSKRRNARARTPVTAEIDPLEPASSASPLPSSVRPALAVTAAEEVETIRQVLLEAATHTTRESWATCTCPECGKSFAKRSRFPTMARGSRPWRRSCEKDSVELGRPQRLRLQHCRATQLASRSCRGRRCELSLRSMNRISFDLRSPRSVHSAGSSKRR
jgi:hypothetical protein